MSAPHEWYEPLILPFIFSFAAGTIWLIAWNAETSGKRANWKWFALAFVALGIYFGFEPFVAIQDYVYARQFIGERKKVIAHHAAVYLPLAVGVGIGVWGFLAKLSRKSASDLANEK